MKGSVINVRRSAACLGAALAAATLAAGCGDNGLSASSAGGVVQLSMLTGFTGPDEPSYQALVAEFNKTHPNIHVTMTVEPWATVAQKLPASWRSEERRVGKECRSRWA